MNPKRYLKFLHSLPLKKFSRNSFKKRERAEFSKVATVSQTSRAFTNRKQHRDESFTSLSVDGMSC